MPFSPRNTHISPSSLLSSDDLRNSIASSPDYQTPSFAVIREPLSISNSNLQHLTACTLLGYCPGTCQRQQTIACSPPLITATPLPSGPARLSTSACSLASTTSAAAAVVATLTGAGANPASHSTCNQQRRRRRRLPQPHTHIRR